MNRLFALLLAAAGLRAQTVTTLIDHGDPANRIDLVVVSEGYTASEMDKFASDAAKYMSNFFASEVYAEYASYFNVRLVAVPSNQSGASHPELNPPVVKDTAFNAAYNCSGVVRLICLNTSKVTAVVNPLLPANQRDYIIVLVNDSTYGGSGGSILVSSTNVSATEIVLHESGHTLGLLADEYTDQPPTCDLSREPTAANATRVTDRNTVKWSAWIDPATPVPTTTTTLGVPGLYLGADYCPTGMYRPTYSSKMRALGYPFEQINDEQLVRRFYNIVSAIDSWSPAASTVTAAQGARTNFSVKPLAPVSHALTTTWTVDGKAIGTTPDLSLDTSSLSAGTHTVTATVRDVTKWVRSDPTNLLADTQSWTLTLTPSAVLAASVSSLAFQTNAGQIPAPQSFTISNAGSGTLAFTAEVATSDGTNWLSVTPTSGTATATLQVSVNSAALAGGTYSGTITLRSSNAANAPVTVRVVLAVVTLPAITSGGIVGAGGSVPAVTTISPGGFTTIYGTGFAPDGTLQSVQSSDLVNGNLPTKLAGVCVQVGGVPAFLTFVGSNQINIQVPTVPLNATANVQVVTNCGVTGEVRANPVPVQVQAASPEFLYWLRRADGKNPIIALNASTGAYIAAPGLIEGLTFTPAKPGDVLTIYGISFGPTNPAYAPGVAPADVGYTASEPAVTLGATALTTADILYAGVSPGTAGLYQLNIRVPANLPDGDYPVTLTLGTFKTPTGGFITVKN